MPMTPCRECGHPVNWTQTAGKWQCFNADGSVHWDKCSQNRWRQTVETGERFEEKRTAEGIASGYANSAHGTKNETLRTKPIRGSRYKTDRACKQCVPPWEKCPNACPIEFRT